jgi:hypothetical protein
VQKPTPQPPPKKRVSEEEEDSDEEEDDPSGLNDLIREGKAGAKQHPNAMPERKISSISHANSISKNTQSGASRLTCFRCGKVGHRKIDCPG